MFVGTLVSCAAGMPLNPALAVSGTVLCAKVFMKFRIHVIWQKFFSLDIHNNVLWVLAVSPYMGFKGMVTLSLPSMFLFLKPFIFVGFRNNRFVL
jgi:hypothetical protein